MFERLPTKVFEIVHARDQCLRRGGDGHLPRAASGALSRVAHRAVSADPSRSRARRPRRSRRFAARLHRRSAADDDVPRRDHGARPLFCSTFRSGCRSEFSPASWRSFRSSARCSRRRCRRCSCSPALAFHGFQPLGHALLVVGLGVVVHLIEGNIVSPLVMSKKVDLPPVLTIMAVLVIGQLLGPHGPHHRAADARRADGDRSSHPHHAHLRGTGLPQNHARARAGASRSGAGRRRHHIARRRRSTSSRRRSGRECSGARKVCTSDEVTRVNPLGSATQ